MSVTYAFSPNTKIRSSEVNTNFTDILVTEWTDYTPDVYGASTAGTPTYVERVGRYCQIRKLLFFTIRVTHSGHTGTGDMRITLPVARSANQANVLFVGAIQVENTGWTSTPINLAIGIGAGNNYFEIYESNNNGAKTKVDVDGNSAFWGSAFYEVD